MGVFKLPWVSEEWFWQCPFNYCDHFGDREVLAKICKICKEDLIREKNQPMDEIEDDGMVFDNMEDALSFASDLLGKELKQDETTGEIVASPIERELLPEETYPLYQVARQYGDQVHKVIMILLNNKALEDVLMGTALDMLMHSEHYIAVKIARAVSSRIDEEHDPIDLELHDSKTSAFFAYIAAVRNAKALRSLADNYPDLNQKHDFIHLAEVSDNIAGLIRDDFFPQIDLNYEEYGTDEQYHTLLPVSM